MNILILGAGGHAQVIADALLCRIRNGEGHKLLGFLDDDRTLQGRTILGAGVLGRLDDVRSVSHDAIIVGIGENRTRKEVFDRMRSIGERFVSVVHPKSIVAEDVTIGEGTIVSAGAIINTGSAIGMNVIVNTGATVDHHAAIGSHVHLAPGVRLGGTVSIGEGAFLGIGCNVIPNRTVGSWSKIGAGALVLKNLPDRVVAYGVPADVVKNC